MEAFVLRPSATKVTNMLHSTVAWDRLAVTLALGFFISVPAALGALICFILLERRHYERADHSHS